MNFLESIVLLTSVYIWGYMHGKERGTGVEGKQWEIALYFSDPSTIVKQNTN